MKNNLLIGESGGSKTDWILLMNNGQVKSSSSSLHPSNWESYDWEQLNKTFDEMNIDFAVTTLHFYGAGCNTETKADELHSHLEKFKFQDMLVQGDLLAAGLAALGTNTGHVAILGSGSVLIDFKNEKVRKYYGGLGRELGDEGGGYYFGKMVLADYRSKKLSAIQNSLLKAALSISEIKKLDNYAPSDDLILKMALLLSDRLFEFEEYHKKNFRLFIEKYVRDYVPLKSEIQFVGSYAYFHEAILKSICHENDYSCGKVIARPIDALIENYKK